MPGDAGRDALIRLPDLPRGAVDRVLDGASPRSGAIVMGTGIVSVALLLDGRETLSRILLVLAALVWAALGVLLPARAKRDPVRFRSDRASPAALTAVAATGVLGTRMALLGWSWAAHVLLVIAVATWIGLLFPVLSQWTTPTIGSSFVLTVGTESLALLAATLALTEHADWLVVVALPPFVLGLVFYVVVLRSFDARQLATGRGDHWITGGALAISTLACAEIARAAERTGTLGGAVDMLEGASLALWGLTLAWLPVLLFAEARHLRGYDLRRWSTVFPVGMYAASSFIVGLIVDVPAITTFAQVWVWVALAVWGLVALGLARAVVRTLGEAAAADPA